MFSYQLFIICIVWHATKAAVSVRRRLGPSEMGSNPQAWARRISSGLKSPSGPIRTNAFSPGRQACCKSGFSPSSQWAMNLRPSKGRRTNSVKPTMPSSCGRVAFCDCFMALIRIFSKRAGLTSLRSEKRQLRQVMASMPISVAFSTNHSVRSMFLVGAIAMWRWKFQRGAGCHCSTISNMQCFG